MDRVAHFFCLLFTALLTGTLFGTLAMNPALLKLPAAGYIGVQQITLKILRPGLFVLMPLTVLSCLPVMLVVYESEPQPSFHFLAVALGLACTVAFIVTTLLVNGPIEREMVGWKVTSIPANYFQYRDRWARAHVIRVAFGVGALVAQIAGVV